MRLKLSYKQRILVYFSVIITIFTVGVIFFEQHQIKRERTQGLERMLDNNADVIHRYITINHLVPEDDIQKSDSLLVYFHEALRVTLIDSLGNVFFENKLAKSKMENHIHRPEIQQANEKGVGVDIRYSVSNQKKYLYYAKKYAAEGYFIRVALPYDIDVASIVNTRNTFIYYILLFFIVCVALTFYFSNRFSKSIHELKIFSENLNNGQPAKMPDSFSDDEVGEISANIIENYNLLQENRRNLALEREKLLQHFQYSEEGIAIFTKNKKAIYSNSHFLQYLNVVLDKPIFEVEQLFSDANFSDITLFLDLSVRNENIFTKRIDKNGKQFNIRVIIFDDLSFELYIGDITRSEKTRLLKQEMTNNIAHELRTPVTSIRGYLETILNLKENDKARRDSFLDRAYAQTIRLSELIQDISMLTKIEEAPDKFDREQVNIRELLVDLEMELSGRLVEKNIRFQIDVNEDVTIDGSRTLLYSIFRNLTENAIAYAGSNINIVVRCYLDNNEAHYFEFYDTGVGVDEKHLVRIFERFYRVSEGRTRDTGGSGLGLSIVKNAVLFHHGNIVAKNRTEGGLSFLISFPKMK